ncbi:MAG: TssQ family T6SS-associated lipoprotein [Sulfuricella sp.]|nr:TssQ family T6SS-associated lipoprotein [Sulfuricella sp.]
MMRSRLLVLISTLLLLLGTGCSSGPVRDVGLDKLSPRKAEQELSNGIKNYEDGNYKTAAKSLQSALESGLTFDSDTVRAHKYLAFIHCLSNREKQCRDEFRKALEKDNKFDLEPAEAGHPIWGPVYRAVKAERRK